MSDKNAAFGELEAPGRFICFDVFDTLLTRAVGNPDDLFLLLGRRLLHRGEIACSAEIFARQRLQAERRANEIRECHPTLGDIYRELGRSLGLPDASIARLLEAELNLERALSRKLPHSDALPQQARQSGAAVVFITDTNMSSAFIRELLSAKNLYLPEDQIFASCECLVDKARGLLFPHVSRALGVRPGALLHHGNDAVADIRNGRLSGLKVLHLPDANLNRYERALTSEAYATGGLSSLLAGASRAARLAVPTTKRRTLASVAAGVMAPTLVAWMMWTMRQASQDGCRRLYFVSRDGQVLLDVARRLEPALRTGLDLRYLYTSRLATQLSGSVDGAFHDLLRLQFCRIKDVADLLQVDPSELAPLLPAHLRHLSKLDNNLSQDNRRELLSLLKDRSFRSLCDQRSAEVRANVVDYLEQEGWADDVPFGIVDVGWRASLAGALRGLLAGTPLLHPARYYFFGLHKGARAIAGPENVNKLEAWFFDDESRHGYLPYLASITSLMEMFCAGDHGAVTGFRREGAKVTPVLRSETSPMHDWGLPELRETTASFTNFFVETIQSEPGLVDIDVDLRRSIDKVTRLFWLDPTAAEVSEWGDFPVEVTMTNNIVMPLAERIGFRQWLHAIRTRTLSLRSSHSWPSGTAARSALPSRMLISGIWRFREDAPRLLRRLRWLKERFGR